MDVLRTTIVFPLQEERVLLGLKKRGFGEGWWNGFGGKLHDGETFADAAVRETREEVGIEVGRLKLVGRLLFSFGGELRVASMVYTTDDFTGEPVEGDEMRPGWFDVKELPYEQMWPADRLWVPKAISPNTTEIQELDVQFDNDKRFLEIRSAQPDLLDQHLPLE